MSSVVAICNQAIGRLRGKQIAALTDDTVEANACSTYYEASRDLVLADFPWNFASKSVAIAQLSEEPIEWAFAYTYPADALTIRKLMASSNLRHYTDPTEWEIGLLSDDTKAILTNLDVAYAKYTKKVTNVNQFSTHFITALGWYLASEIAIPIAGVGKGRVLADRALQGYMNAIKAAYAVNANEGDEGPPRDPETIRAHQ
jgi:hypothetical protein